MRHAHHGAYDAPYRTNIAPHFKLHLAGSIVTIHTALDIRERYNFSWYDSLIVATALEADCATLYSEDMQNGQEIEGRLRIIIPFV